jgi:hypothetical protein
MIFLPVFFSYLRMLVLQVRVLEKRLDDQFVMRRALEKALGYKPCAVHASSVNCIPEVKVHMDELKKIGGGGGRGGTMILWCFTSSS